MEEKDEYHHNSNLMPQANWFIKILSFQADIIHDCILTLSSPITLVFSMAYESDSRTQEATAKVESALLKIPFKVTYGSIVLVRKIGIGILGAVHALVVLLCVMFLAGFLFVVLVQLWVEEPVFTRERLFFDYTDVNFKAVFSFSGSSTAKKRLMGVPTGHTFHVSF